MERNQAISLVRETFGQRFDENRFAHFIRNLVNHLDESKRQVWTLRKAAFEGFVNHFLRLGTYTDPRGERVDVLVIHLRKETTLARGRVTLRNFVADYLTTGHGQGKAAVIAAFVSPTEDDWRFSFIKLDYTIETTELGFVTESKQLTPAKRYSYLVGKNENCHTAQKQFLELLQTDYADPTVEALESAFGVEKVTKEFFEHYRSLFEKSRDALKTFLNTAPEIMQEFEERGITTDDFAKKLLGQIVFLYFLQKKGWFGVDRGQAWGSGRKDFIRHLFEERATYAALAAKKGGRKCNFFNDILEPLFYDALSRPRLEEDHYYPSFDCRIPFLNGGLFEPLYGYQWVETDILLPDTLFSNDELDDEGDTGTGILDVFDRYNFTVNEAEPLEKEVAVDPEMLGKVFENLLPENIRHASGTYYTPRVIVHYMCQQALLNYLSTRAPNISQDDLSVFLRLAERFADFEATDTKAHEDKRLPESISKNAELLDELLASITVCDPAIGSGAFPVGMMHEIVRARMALTPALEKKAIFQASDSGNSRSAYALKRHVIHYSLYGVDEDPGAVEIAKLRLWLSMVVDEDEISDIQPLPNLDYKIMQGNSLLEEFDGIPLLNERLFEQIGEDRPNPRIAEIENRQSWVQKEVLRLHAAGRLTRKISTDLKKEAARLEKERKVLLNPPTSGFSSQIDLPLGSRESLKHIQQLHDDFFKESSRVEKDKIRDRLERLEWEFMRATLREQGREQALVELERAIAKHRKPFFLWRLHFAEVFQEKGGFDVVIANPPFVRMELIKDQKPALKRRFPDLFSGRADLYVYFYGLGLNILCDSGCLAFISSNTYLNSKFGEKLRKYFVETSTIATLIDFAETKVFDAVVEPAIVVLSKHKSNDIPVRIVKWQEAQPLAELPEVMLKQATIVPQTTFGIEPWRLESPALLRLLDHLKDERVSTPLDKYIGGNVFYGVKTGLNEAFVIDAVTRERLLKDPRSKEIIKPFLRGRDIAQWTTRPVTSWLIYTHHGVDISRYPLIEEYLRPFKSDLEARATEQAWYELQQPQYRYSKFFEAPKIIYQDIARYFGMAWDETGAYLANTCYFIPTDEKWLLGILLSSTISFHVQKTVGSDEGGFIRLFTMHVKKFPIPHAESTQKTIISCIVEYLLLLHRAEEIDGTIQRESGDKLLIGYFEQLINALVYELFFPDKLHHAGLHFFKIAEQAHFPKLSEIENGKEIKTIYAKFEELYATSHPLRQGLFSLDSIEEVRIIEGKA